MVYTLSPSGGARSVNLTVTDGPLQPGLYRFTAHASGLAGPFGNPLDGNTDGTGGDDLVLHFTVAIPAGSRAGEPQQRQHPGGDPVAAVRGPGGERVFDQQRGTGGDRPGRRQRLLELRRPGRGPAGRRHGADLRRQLCPAFIVYNAAGETIFDTYSGGYSWFGSPAKTTPPVSRSRPTAPTTCGPWTGPATASAWAATSSASTWAASVQLEPYDFNFVQQRPQQRQQLPPGLAPGAPGHLVGDGGRVVVLAGGAGLLPAGPARPGQHGHGRQPHDHRQRPDLPGPGGGQRGRSDARPGRQPDRCQGNVAVAQRDDYYLKVEAIGGVGIRGQYLVDIDVQDTVPPKITSHRGLPAEGGTIGLVTNPITLNFSKDLQTAGVNAAATYEVRRRGRTARSARPTTWSTR